jgi:hypothetical protein
LLTHGRQHRNIASACSGIGQISIRPQPLDYLTLWKQGASQPMVSTLNASDAAITSNMAIVPVNNGEISAFVPQRPKNYPRRFSWR